MRRMYILSGNRMLSTRCNPSREGKCRICAGCLEPGGWIDGWKNQGTPPVVFAAEEAAFAPISQKRMLVALPQAGLRRL